MTKTITVQVSLDDFSDEEIAAYLRQQGYQVEGIGSGVCAINTGALEDVERLALCGQITAAQSEALALVGRAIGRTLQ